MANEKSANPFMDMFQQFGQNLKLPTADVGAVVDYHRKNIQAMQDVTQVTATGARSLMTKQREILEQTLGEAAEMIKSASDMKDPGKMISNQMEFARRSFDATIKNTTEMGEIIQDMNMQNYSVLKSRIEESINDIKETMSVDKSK
ncbi:MAG: TIGR01841 family phasin [Pseudomonadota bacterium]